MQRTGKSILQIFARLHFLTQIFAHSCNSLRNEFRMDMMRPLVMVIVIYNPFLRDAFDDR